MKTGSCGELAIAPSPNLILPSSRQRTLVGTQTSGPVSWPSGTSKKINPSSNYRPWLVYGGTFLVRRLFPLIRQSVAGSLLPPTKS